MSNTDLTTLLLALLLLVGFAQLLGALFVKMRQPRVIGEIAAGILLGPAILGNLSLGSLGLGKWGLSGFQGGTFADITRSHAQVLDFSYWMGLLLLMFLSGAETRQLFTREERREVGWLVAVGTGIPFILGLAAGPWLSTPRISSLIAGPKGTKMSLMIVMAISIAVTSVPVISKIFADLKILHTRFARLVLGVAVAEDIGLWAALAVATSLAGKTVLNPWEMAQHLAATLGFFALGLTIVPRMVKRFNKARFNVVARQAPVAYALSVLLAYCVAAGVLNVSLVFAAFLAGFAVIHKKRNLFAEALEAISKVSFAFFIPLYFAMVGLKLDLIRGLSWTLLAVFILGTCAIKILSVSLAGRLAGFRGLDVLNLALTTNARGGPGIVLASVAFDAGIINATFYTTLVIAAVVTSQIAGAWLDYVLRKGWPLLSEAVPASLAVAEKVEV